MLPVAINQWLNYPFLFCASRFPTPLPSVPCFISPLFDTSGFFYKCLNHPFDQKESQIPQRWRDSFKVTWLSSSIECGSSTFMLLSYLLLFRWSQPKKKCYFIWKHIPVGFLTASKNSVIYGSVQRHLANWMCYLLGNEEGDSQTWFYCYSHDSDFSASIFVKWRFSSLTLFCGSTFADSLLSFFSKKY